MITIHKFILDHDDVQRITIQESAIPLHVGLDPNGTACIWFKVQTDQALIQRRVFMVGTGNPMPDLNLIHVGSFTEGHFVWHIFTSH